MSKIKNSCFLRAHHHQNWNSITGIAILGMMWYLLNKVDSEESLGKITINASLLKQNWQNRFQYFTQEELQRIIDELDLNSDGRIHHIELLLYLDSSKTFWTGPITNFHGWVSPLETLPNVVLVSLKVFLALIFAFRIHNKCAEIITIHETKNNLKHKIIILGSNGWGLNYSDLNYRLPNKNVYSDIPNKRATHLIIFTDFSYQVKGGLI